MQDISKLVMTANLNEMTLEDVKPLDKDWMMVFASKGDKVRMTMQGLGGKELYLIEIVRSY